MSQIENKMDDFMPFGGEIRSKYPEDDETVQHAIIDACFAALDDIMFPMDDRGKRPSECQVFFAVQRMYGAEKALDMPAEEYIMVHDGVKTEFQITEVKEDSFVYDQGARFDVKVLTDGHICGYGHFCADLDDAHGFCERFADEIVGVGESLDDMCENRREVASMAQDVDAEDRGLEDKNHDNSEIGE